jgi:hypothetical protein
MYSTTDLNVGAFLIARGHKLVQVTGEGAQKKFGFHDDARRDVDNYFLDALVPARSFAAALKTLKSAIYATR